MDEEETQPFPSPLYRPESRPEPTPLLPAPYLPPPPPYAPAPYPPRVLYPPVVRYAGPPAPYGVDPVTGIAWSDKSRVVAGTLQLALTLFGVPGVGRLYAGNIGIGLTQLLGFLLGIVSMIVLIGFLVVPAVWLWAVVDGIVLLAAGGRDGRGRPLRP